MRITVVQHALRATPAQDLEALVIAVGAAVAGGADAVVLPDVPAIADGPLADELWRRIADVASSVTVLLSRPEGDGSPTAAVTEVGALGRTALLSGDACVDPEALAAVRDEDPDVAVLMPRSESELQAQAVLELAIGLSTSLCSLVIVADPDGAGLGDPGHGGSAVVHLGEVLAEAMSGDDMLAVEIELPAGPPEPRDALPEVPPVLLQRLAAHRGRKIDVGYPADLD